jgi:hypothetical protein
MRALFLLILNRVFLIADKVMFIEEEDEIHLTDIRSICSTTIFVIAIQVVNVSIDVSSKDSIGDNMFRNISPDKNAVASFIPFAFSKLIQTSDIWRSGYSSE